MDPPFLYSGSSNDPVNTLTGSYAYSHVDVSIPGRGANLVFQRAYNTNDTRPGPLGTGWTHSYNVRLTNPGDGTTNVVLVGAQGRSDVYTANAGAYSPPPAVYTRLSHNADGSYTATQPDLTSMTFSSGGKLLSIKDWYGNQTSLIYNGSGQLIAFADPAGRGSLTLGYDPTTGLLVSVTDWASPARTVRYGYDASGRLQTVTDRNG